MPSSILSKGWIIYKLDTFKITLNTQAAKQGVAGVEVDLRFTADGIGILLHDDTVDRTTNGHGKVRQMTFDEIRRLDASAQHKSRWLGKSW